jgi:hypothetical protein
LYLRGSPAPTALRARRVPVRVRGLFVAPFVAASAGLPYLTTGSACTRPGRVGYDGWVARDGHDEEAGAMTIYGLSQSSGAERRLTVEMGGEGIRRE